MKFDPNSVYGGKVFRVRKQIKDTSGTIYPVGTILTFSRVEWRGPYDSYSDYYFSEATITSDKDLFELFLEPADEKTE